MQFGMWIALKLLSRNSETMNSILSACSLKSWKPQSKVHILKCTHSRSKANSHSFSLPVVYLVFQEFQINAKEVAQSLKALFYSSCLQLSTGKYGRKDEWFMNTHLKKSNNILKQYFIVQWNRIKQTIFTVIFIERTCTDFWQEKKN